MPTIALDSPFAIGHTAEVYLWEEGKILKLFRDWFPRRAIEHEARIARIVHDAGIVSPSIGDEIIDVDGRLGLVYERVVGISLLETLLARPWSFSRYARLLAELQVEIHNHGGIDGLPVQYEKLRNKILDAQMLAPDLQAAALSLLETLPAESQLCHGDFHADNILLTADGPVIIDWIDASSGNPLSDMARSSLLMTETPLPENKSQRWLVSLLRERFHRAYLKRYFQLCPGEQEEFAQWRLINAAARLSENIPEEQALIALLNSN